MVGICVKMFFYFVVFSEQNWYLNLICRSFPSLDLESQSCESGEESGKNDIARAFLELGTYLFIVLMGVYLVGDMLEAINNF